MKRLLILFTFTLFAVVLTACQDKPAGPKENTMMLSFKNNADFTFHSIGISTRDISGGILNADGSPIEKGQILRKEYIDQTDIDLEGEAAFNIALIDKEENRIPLKTKILKLEENKEYFFEITGSSESDAALKRIDKAGG